MEFPRPFSRFYHSLVVDGRKLWDRRNKEKEKTNVFPSFQRKSDITVVMKEIMSLKVEDKGTHSTKNYKKNS